MITPEIRQKLAAVYELTKQGVDGERAAARAAIDRLLKKYKLEGINLESLDQDKYSFKYSTEMEQWLICRLIRYFISAEILETATRSTYKVRQVNLLLKYVDYVTLDCAYEYFRRHMKAQWNLFCAPEIARLRSRRKINARRKQLQDVFFTAYCIKSKLYKEGDLTTVDISDMSPSEIKDRVSLQNIEGGSYNKQVVTGNLLEA